jgi:chromosome segregation ATPase
LDDTIADLICTSERLEGAASEERVKSAALQAELSAARLLSQSQAEELAALRASVAALQEAEAGTRAKYKDRMQKGNEAYLQTKEQLDRVAGELEGAKAGLETSTHAIAALQAEAKELTSRLDQTQKANGDMRMEWKGSLAQIDALVRSLCPEDGSMKGVNLDGTAPLTECSALVAANVAVAVSSINRSRNDTEAVYERLKALEKQLADKTEEARELMDRLKAEEAIVEAKDAQLEVVRSDEKKAIAFGANIMSEKASLEKALASTMGELTAANNRIESLRSYCDEILKLLEQKNGIEC